ncbi:MAG: uncharacterized protein JWO81_3340 [Alphaproteobacteria bacterium]|nr:uncharacterized protein [Alphaproteobacteria bacterium]
MTQCWGIYREPSHSPGRIDDDAGIMDAVAAALADHDLVATLLPPEAADAAFAAPAAGIFAMCEREAILARLDDAVGSGIPVVNAPEAVRNTYRRRTVERFRLGGVPSPASRIVPAAAPGPAPASQVWVKRPDFHATQAADVVFAGSDDEWRAALAGFVDRGIHEVVVQAHVPGDLVKFYGVVGSENQPRWFHWFYHRDQELAGHAFSLDALRNAAFRAAGALGVEIFGGDAIVGPDGRPLVIDLNAWPSFALCRTEAAAAIARHLACTFNREASAPRLATSRMG